VLSVAVQLRPISADAPRGQQFSQYLTVRLKNRAARRRCFFFRATRFTITGALRGPFGDRQVHIRGGWWPAIGTCISRQASDGTNRHASKCLISEVPGNPACDDRHGFMRIMITQNYLVGEY